MHDLLHAKAIEVDLEYYENSQYYDTLYRTRQEVPFRPARILNGLLQIGRSSISLLALSGLLFSLHWSVPVILLAASFPSVIVGFKYSRKFYQWQRKSTLTERKASYLSQLLTEAPFAKEVRLFSLGELFNRRFVVLRHQLYREKLSIFTRRAVEQLVSQSISSLMVFSVSVFLVYQAFQKTITLGDLFMYQQAFQRSQGFLGEILRGLANLYENNLFLSHLYEFLSLKPKLLEPIHPKPFPRPMVTGIVFNCVGFQYPDSTRTAFEKITLTIPAGQTVALVGENGAGKTTLLKLLCRLYDPTTGSITIDGIDLRQFSTTELRSQISVIFQDYVNYHLTVQENIWLGNINLPPDHEHIISAARHAGAHEFITSLPQNYETILGKHFEEGEELSIGQWQKLALARALLRKAQIIILDEPTSSLDAKAEAEVFEKFRQQVKGKTAILISHRLSTIKMADYIYVFEKGRIVESGTHDELWRLNRVYAHLFKTQSPNSSDNFVSGEA
jgi:ATP-binding cassette subfamily B protein